MWRAVKICMHGRRDHNWISLNMKSFRELKRVFPTYYILIAKTNHILIKKDIRPRCEIDHEFSFYSSCTSLVYVKCK